MNILVEYLYCFLLVDLDLCFFVTCCVGDGQVRKEAEMMLAIAIEERNKEALSAAVALATQLRLRTPQVRFLFKLILVIPYPRSCIYIHILQND